MDGEGDSQSFSTTPFNKKEWQSNLSAICSELGENDSERARRKLARETKEADEATKRWDSTSDKSGETGSMSTSAIDISTMSLPNSCVLTLCLLFGEVTVEGRGPAVSASSSAGSCQRMAMAEVFKGG